MAVFEIPLEARNQRFQITLEGIEYGIRVLWNVPAQCWMLDLYDAADVPILTGTAIVTGADLLEQYPYLYIGGLDADSQLVVVTTAVGKSPDEIPTRTNLGTDGKLFYVT
jgi:hypothetical protein